VGLGVYSINVQKSVMPKGVEHADSTPTSITITVVQKSVMPKGVEHNPHYGVRDGYIDVQKSVMPKGVEHLTTRATGVQVSPCAEVSDAERR
jgi:hypothetical protein